MGVFSDLMGAVSSWITAKGNVAELEYKHKSAEQEHKRYIKGQWDRLFCSEDYNSIKLLGKFIDNNDWTEINDDMESALSSVEFCGADKYSDVKIYHKGEKFPLFQTKTETMESREYYGEKIIEYIRITPKIYSDFRKQYLKYQKNGMF